MKNKILPFSVIIIFGVIFFIFYKGLEDSNIYTPDINTKNDSAGTSLLILRS